jgi:hypothetical protein
MEYRYCPKPEAGRKVKMLKEMQSRTSVLPLALLTVAACVFAFINFQKQSSFEQPTDGVWWVESASSATGLHAERVPEGSPAQRAGIKPGDQLVAIHGTPTPTYASAIEQMFRTGVMQDTTYSLVRNGVPLDVKVILDSADHSEYIAPPVDGAPRAPFLSLLPRVLRPLRVSLYRQAERVRLDHLLEQHRRLRAAAGAVPALRCHFPR